MVEKTEVTEEEAKAAVKEVKAKAKVTEEEAVNNQFDDKTLRLGFLRKVYAILTAQVKTCTFLGSKHCIDNLQFS